MFANNKKLVLIVLMMLYAYLIEQRYLKVMHTTPIIATTPTVHNALGEKTERKQTKKIGPSSKSNQKGKGKKIKHVAHSIAEQEKKDFLATRLAQAYSNKEEKEEGKPSLGNGEKQAKSNGQDYPVSKRENKTDGQSHKNDTIQKLTSPIKYWVKKSDSLWKIVREIYQTTNAKHIRIIVEEIIKNNNFLKKNANSIKVGTKLVLPSYQNVMKLLQRQNVMHSLPLIHIVQSGETIYGIARMYLSGRKRKNKNSEQPPVLQIINANPTIHPDEIRSGTRLAIPLCSGD